MKTYSNKSPGRSKQNKHSEASPIRTVRPLGSELLPILGNTGLRRLENVTSEDLVVEDEAAWIEQCMADVDVPDDQNLFAVLRSFLEKGNQTSFAYMLPDVTVHHGSARGNVAFNPYSFRVVSYTECKGSEYYTLSLAGVTKFAYGAMEEFVPLKQWRRERSIFNSLVVMPFFKSFRWQKPFSLWKSVVKARKFARVASNLKDKLLRAQLILCDCLLSLRFTWLQIEENSPALLPTLDQGDSKVSLEDFSESQQCRAKNVSERVRSMWCKSVDMMKACLARFVAETAKSENFESNQPESLDTSAKSLEATNVKDMKSSKIHYAVRASKRLVQSRIFRFAKLCNFLIVDCLHDFAIASVEAVLRRMDPASRWCIPIFPTLILFNGHELAMSPSAEDFTAHIQEITSGIVESICTGSSLLTSSDLKSFWTLNDEQVTSKDPTHDAISVDRSLKRKIDAILSFSKQIYCKAADIVSGLTPHLQVHTDSGSFDFSLIVREADEKFGTALPKMLAMIRRFEGQRDSLSDIPEHVDCWILQLLCSPLKVELEKYPARCIARVHDLMIEHFIKTQNIISELLLKTSASLSIRADTLDSFVKLRTSSLAFEDQIPRFESQIEELMSQLTIVKSERIPIPELVIQDCIQLTSKLNHVKTSIDTANELFYRKRNYWKDVVEREIQIFVMELPHLKRLVEDSKLLDVATDKSNTIKQIIDKISICEDKVKRFAEYSTVLRRDVDDFSELEDLAAQARLRLQLWEVHKSIRLELQSAQECTLEQLPLQLWKDNANRWSKFFMRAERELPTGSLLTVVKMQIQQYIRVVDLSSHLMNPVMKQRHWEVLFAQTGHRLNPHKAYSQHKSVNSVHDVPGDSDGFLTLGQILCMLDDSSHLEQGISHVSEEATKEHELEVILNQIKSLWSGKEFMFVPYHRDDEMLLLDDIEELQRVLDESLLSLAAILSSQYSEPIRVDIETSLEILQRLKLYIEEWINLQKHWLHLEPIFSSLDIQRQLPGEARQFFVIAKEVKKLVKRASNVPNCVKLSSMIGQRELFMQLRHGFERIKRSLQDYLEAKRMAFPRFHFLADDELIQMLAQTRNIQIVQDHITKCFQGVKGFHLAPAIQSKRRTSVFLTQDLFLSRNSSNSAQNLDIKGMISKEDECVYFDNPLKIRGEIEHWLSAFEKKMVESLRQEAKASLSDVDSTLHSSKEDEEFLVDQYPCQILILRQQILWCRGTEKAISQSQLQSRSDELSKWMYLHRAGLLQQCTRLGEDIDNLQRAKFSTVLTVEVHHRDILTRIHQKKVSSLSDFEWLMCLRYYWSNETGECQIKQIAAAFYYTFEYWGATTRLVLTALTDKCYMTLTSALHLSLGGAPFGPAGTGKTETTKDLAKSFGRQCIVFNCGDNLDTHFMRRFFMGLAQCGAWACLDEFNRISVDVLSVVAQLIISLQMALRSKVEQMEFEGKLIRIMETLGIFVTMNPGSASNSAESYAGRSELPDNLKALFRPCAMMIPDFEPVAEVMLFVQGFHEAHILANKLVDLYRLSAEQLSQAKHYDFGMRAIKSLLVLAGMQKRKCPLAAEESVLRVAIYDCNIPKLTQSDQVIFTALMLDVGFLLNSNQDHADHKKEIENDIRKTMHDNGFQPIEMFIEKIIQFVSTLPIRFGLLILGPCDGGKTILISTAAALPQNEIPESDIQTHVYCINPKCVSVLDLYGYFDNATKEWKDGLASAILRDQRVDPIRSVFKWVVFDGPIDAIWIENMNTVLDDNQCLCLANGERIQLDSSRLKIIFEVDDISFASPATISRLGVVFLPAALLPALAVTKTIMKTNLPSSLTNTAHSHIMQASSMYLLDCIEFLRKECREKLSMTDNNIARSFCSIFVAIFLKVLSEAEAEALPPMVASKDNGPFEYLVKEVLLFSLAWSVGANLDDIGQEKFGKWIQDKSYFAHIWPSSDKLHHFYIDSRTCKVSHFQALTPDLVFDPKVKVSDVMVPTVETTSFGYIFELLAQNGRNILFHGPSGGGRSMFIGNKITALANAEQFFTVTLLFSAQISSLRVQETLEAHVERKTKSSAAPPLNKKLVVFVDDINLPQPEQYGAQPPVELLRQVIDENGLRGAVKLYGYGGMYDRTTWQFCEISSVVFVSSCCDSQGKLSSRFTRHLNLIHVGSVSATILRTIFFSLLENHLRSFHTEVQDLCKATIDSTVQLHEQLSVELVPTPTKFHYLFNIRDIAKVIQGLMFIRSEDCVNPHVFIKLWIHETQRVYQDRLTDVADIDLLCQNIHQLLRSRFKLRWSFESIFAEPILFCDFTKLDVPKNERRYLQIDNITKLHRVAQHSLGEYNRINSKTMDLVLYKQAIEHIARLTRILRFPQGHAMLVGVAGSGKQSAARLASFIGGHECFQIQARRGYTLFNFREDLKKVFYIAGVDLKSVVFLIDDSDLIEEMFLDLVNSMLDSGQIQDLYNPSEQDKIISEVNRVCRENKISTGGNAAHYFQQTVRENVHLVLSLSPIGDTLRNRCRTFPSLLSCCAIDWYLPWSSEAFETVADGIFVSSFKMSDLAHGNLPITVEDRKKLAQLCVHFHQIQENQSQKFNRECQQHYYLSPKIFVDFIEAFLYTLTEKVLAIVAQRDMFSKGISKMAESSSTIELLRKEVEALKPVLEEKQTRIEELLSQISIDKDAANAVREKVEKETSIVEKQAEKVALIREDAQRDLDQALPILESAIAALNSLTRTDIVEVKSFLKPPALVQVVMEAICTLLKEPISWESSRKVLGSTSFMDRLLNYEKDSIDPKIIQNLKKYIDNPEFVPEQVGKVSKAARGLCMWCRAIDVYAAISKEVEPKRLRLKVADNDLAQSKILLRLQCEKLKEANESVDLLEKRLRDAQDELASLQNQMAICESRLNRSSRLTNALGEELQAWRSATHKCKDQLLRVVGNALVYSAYVNYCAPYNSGHRTQAMGLFTNSCILSEIEVSIPFSLQKVFSSEADLLNWSVDGLPSDMQSIENGIIINNCRRWPLVIDPQLQANKWLKRTIEKRGVRPLRLDEETWLRSLETGIKNGTIILIENVSAEMDPLLLPILQKQVIEQSGHKYISLGEVLIEYDVNFRLILTTKISNPHIVPSICNFLTIVNFISTPAGIEEQVLSDLVRKERPELEQSREKLVISMANDQKLLDDLQRKILILLDESEGVILDNEHLVTTLLQSQQTSNVISHRFKDAIETDTHIAEARNGYRVVARRASILYFTIADLMKINIMYQYSLQDFKQLYTKYFSLQENFIDSLEEYVEKLVTGLTNFVVAYISRGLFDSHRLMFAFLICTAIDRNVGTINDADWAVLLAQNNHTSFSQNDHSLKEKDATARSYESAKRLESLLPGLFDGLSGSFQTDPAWAAWMHSLEPQRLKIPSPGLSEYGKLILFKTYHQDKLLDAIRENISKRLVLPPQASFGSVLREIFSETNSKRPIVVLLSAGSDPTQALLQYFDDLKLTAAAANDDSSIEAPSQDQALDFHCVSMGQGQGLIAEKLINVTSKKGGWICLSNIHLAGTWVQSLERVVEDLASSLTRTADTFRLWLTSMPFDQFPVTVLGKGYKIVCEAPTGLRANLHSSLLDVGKQEWDFHPKPAPWRKLLTSLCFFHSVVKERKKFGPVGWNEVYDFDRSDFLSAHSILKLFVDQFDIMPWEALRYITSHIIYGGRVTDDLDQRCLSCLMSRFYCDAVLVEDEHKINGSNMYRMNKAPTFEDMLVLVQKLPNHDEVDVFGLDQNSEYDRHCKESLRFLQVVAAIQPVSRQEPGDDSHDMPENTKAIDFLDKLLSRVPPVQPAWKRKDDPNHMSPLEIVLEHEIEKYDNLLGLMHKSLNDSLLALNGQLPMTAEFDEVVSSCQNNNVPRSWIMLSYSFEKPLSSWLSDLALRTAFFQQWAVRGATQPSFWLSAFYFPRQFLTACLQQHSRAHAHAGPCLKFASPDATGSTSTSTTCKGVEEPSVNAPPNRVAEHSQRTVPLAALTIRFIPTTSLHPESFDLLPVHGVYAYGAFLEGGAWDLHRHRITHSHRAVRWAPLPVFHLEPVQAVDFSSKPSADSIDRRASHAVGSSARLRSLHHGEEYYPCPLYQTTARRGGTSSTGASHNLVLVTPLPALGTQDTWILRGTAMVLQTPE